MTVGCTGCGVCCSNIGRVFDHMATLKPGERYYDEFRAFPYEPGPDGSCPQLREDNTCGVYDSRPGLCDSKALYDRYFREEVSGKEFEVMSAFACNSMIREAGLGKEWLVKVDITGV